MAGAGAREKYTLGRGSKKPKLMAVQVGLSPLSSGVGTEKFSTSCHLVGASPSFSRYLSTLWIRLPFLPSHPFMSSCDIACLPCPVDIPPFFFSHLSSLTPISFFFFSDMKLIFPVSITQSLCLGFSHCIWYLGQV